MFKRFSWQLFQVHYTAQKLKFSINDIFSKCDQIHNFLRINWRNPTWKTWFSLQCQPSQNISPYLMPIIPIKPRDIFTYTTHKWTLDFDFAFQGLGRTFSFTWFCYNFLWQYVCSKSLFNSMSNKTRQNVSNLKWNFYYWCRNAIHENYSCICFSYCIFVL